MKLVEAEAEGPVEGEEAVVTAPRPPHRRVSVSLLFTLTVLTGTVVAIYMVFPARDRALLAEAVQRYRDPTPPWDLPAPSPDATRAWVMGVAGKDAPLPALDAPGVSVIGVRQIQVLDRRTAILRLAIAGEQVSYMVQHARGIAPARTDRAEGDLRAVAWSHGAYSCAAIGPSASAERWLAVVRP